MNVDKQRKGFRTWGHGAREPVNKLLSFLGVFDFGRHSDLHPASVSNTSRPDMICYVVSQPLLKKTTLYYTYNYIQNA